MAPIHALKTTLCSLGTTWTSDKICSRLERIVCSVAKDIQAASSGHGRARQNGQDNASSNTQKACLSDMLDMCPGPNIVLYKKMSVNKQNIQIFAATHTFICKKIVWDLACSIVCLFLLKKAPLFWRKKTKLWISKICWTFPLNLNSMLLWRLGWCDLVWNNISVRALMM